jgi:hypothetical protein
MLLLPCLELRSFAENILDPVAAVVGIAGVLQSNDAVDQWKIRRVKAG